MVTIVTTPKSLGVSRRASTIVDPICTKKEAPCPRIVTLALRIAVRRSPETSTS